MDYLIGMMNSRGFRPELGHFFLLQVQITMVELVLSRDCYSSCRTLLTCIRLHLLPAASTSCGQMKSARLWELQIAMPLGMTH